MRRDVADVTTEVMPGTDGRLAQAGHRDQRLVLVSHTTPWPTVSLIDFLRPATGLPRVCWESDQSPVGLAGHGAAAVLMADGPDRFQVIGRGATRLFEHAIVEAVDAPPAAGPRLFGGFAFDAAHAPERIWAAFPAAWFILPRHQLTRIGDRAWLTVNRLVDGPPATDGGAPAPNGRHGNGQPETPAAPPALHSSMDVEAWRRLVTAAVDRIRRGELEKVVLARTCDVRMERQVQPMDVLARLKQRYPGCRRFLFEPVPGHVFCGATPELLVQVEGSTLSTVAMAGSVARGSSPDEDAALARELLASPKERHEHQLVVEAIEAALRPIATSLCVPDHPTVCRLPNIQHLETPIRGELPEGVGVLTAVEALHPTPAVGGVPRGPALRMIAGEEAAPRGWYAAPVGWIDPQGSGVFSVALRSAVSVGSQVRLFAGAGIVADSDPDREWAETALKFRPMLEALGVRS